MRDLPVHIRENLFSPLLRMAWADELRLGGTCSVNALRTSLSDKLNPHLPRGGTSL